MTDIMMEDILFKLGDAYGASPLVGCMMVFSSEKGFASTDQYNERLQHCQRLFKEAETRKVS
jgi:hypothetical protein